MIKPLVCVAFIFVLAVISRAADESKRLVIYEGVATGVGPAPAKTVALDQSGRSVKRATSAQASPSVQPFDKSHDLWVTLKDLTRATKFILKPQGMCRDELCIPIPKTRKGEFILKQGRTTWFNLSEFARLVRQPVAHDEKHAIWLFGSRRDAEGGYLSSLEAPNFTLPDMNGKLHSLSDFRGKKVLLITWASW